ncbi:hypothetical protein H4O18_17715 [Arenibacter sp. BSSL-BM3]|uniref:Transmembrane anchor protein n=1 Tax=Arenibacter arenosicollis TaxID=2762274 RepID=A0ABR7QRN2_9FLAO|nr:hypothetical protein [Arenibacter arenosicollis]MBC8769841.1 hypothetical protein [Arenibacter arenosicollis]
MTTNKQLNLTKGQILKSLLIALLIGAAVLVTAVLPAEYGIDPLGTGELLGFSKLYQGKNESETIDTASILNFNKIKMEKLGSPQNTPKPSEANNPPPKVQYPNTQDSIEVIVPAKKGIEYKFKSLKYGSIKYEWATDKGIVYIDFHGEVKQENPPKNVFYESYTLAYSNNMAGTLTAPFEGKHGWYFRNETNEDIVVTIRLNGQYVLFE